ncbi:hypothetical protein [Streptomyces sp. NPDC021608]
MEPVVTPGPEGSPERLAAARWAGDEPRLGPAATVAVAPHD